MPVLSRASQEKVSQQKMKRVNLARLFSDLRSSGPLSRAELASRCALSPTTVSHLVSDLIGRGIVHEIGSASLPGAGRRPIQLAIRPDGGCLLVVVMAAGQCRLLLYNLVLHVLGDMKLAIDDYHRLGETVAQAANRLLQNSGTGRDKLLGVVFSVPALIDYAAGRIIYSTVIPFDPANDLVRIMHDQFGLPVRLGNEAAFWCYAENYLAGPYSDASLAFIDVTDGIGCGLMNQGDLFFGAHGLQGEIGHITINFGGPPCPCHNRGCLEQYASVPVLERRAARRALEEPDSCLSFAITMAGDANGDDRSTEPPRVLLGDLVLAAADGDHLARALLREEAEYLAYGINSLVNLFDPDRVVLGGALQRAGEPFLDELNACLKEICQNPASARVQLSQLAPDAMPAGAAQWLLDELVCQDQIFGRSSL